MWKFIKQNAYSIQDIIKSSINIALTEALPVYIRQFNEATSKESDAIPMDIDNLDQHMYSMQNEFSVLSSNMDLMQ